MLIKEAITGYLQHLRILDRSPLTLLERRNTLRRFLKFLENEQVFELNDLTYEDLEEYQQELAFSLTAKGTLLAIGTQIKVLRTIKSFTRFLKDQDYLVHDPGNKIKLPRKPKLLPRGILSTEEVKKLLKAPDLRTNQGYRDRIILEILYDTAIRRSELCNIRLNDLDLKAGFIQIRQGKGQKDRVVPLSKRVCDLVQTYLLMVRPVFLQEKEGYHLILNRWGRKMNPGGLYEAVRRCAKDSGIKRRISTHTFRHTCATHMLRNGAPVSHIQEMLGHASLESTQIYTRVTINDLKEIHAKYHPSEKMTDDGRPKTDARRKKTEVRSQNPEDEKL